MIHAGSIPVYMFGYVQIQFDSTCWLIFPHFTSLHCCQFICWESMCVCLEHSPEVVRLSYFISLLLVDSTLLPLLTLPLSCSCCLLASRGSETCSSPQIMSQDFVDFHAHLIDNVDQAKKEQTNSSTSSKYANVNFEVTGSLPRPRLSVGLHRGTFWHFNTRKGVRVCEYGRRRCRLEIHPRWFICRYKLCSNWFWITFVPCQQLVHTQVFDLHRILNIPSHLIAKSHQFYSQGYSTETINWAVLAPV